MDIEALRQYSLTKRGPVREETPFGENVLVYKVRGKIFLLLNLADHPLAINLKCDPTHAIELRERYPAVQAGYHMNKKHWNTVTLDGSIPIDEVRRIIDESYAEVVKGLSKRDRARLSSS